MTYRPTSDLTFFTGFRTGFKCGGFNASLLVTPTNQISDFDYAPETAKGFDAGAKAILFDRRMTLNATIYTFDYKNLQVLVYYPTTISFLVGNAGLLRTRGVELDGSYQFGSRNDGLRPAGRTGDIIGNTEPGRSVALQASIKF